MPDVEAVTRAECAAGSRHADVKPKGVRSILLNLRARLSWNLHRIILMYEGVSNRLGLSQPWCSATRCARVLGRTQVRRGGAGSPCL